MSVVQTQMKQRLVVSTEIVFRPGRELLIGGHERGGDVVCEEERVGVDVQELDHVVVPDDTPSPSFGDGFGGNDLPVVVSVVVAVSRHLLACKASSRDCCC